MDASLMHKFKIATILVLLSLVNCQLTNSWSQARPKQRIISGQEAQGRVTKLISEISWYTDLSHAEKLAQQSGKPIFWLHVLGPLNGMT